MRRQIFVPVEFIVPEEFKVELKRVGDKFEVSYTEFFDEGERELAEKSLELMSYLTGPSFELAETKIEGNSCYLRFCAPFNDAINYILGEVALRRFAYRDEVHKWAGEVALSFPERPTARLVQPTIKVEDVK